MAYVYIHKKKSNGAIFYVGIGSDDKGLYTRAHTLHGRDRNQHWRNVVNKHGYYVEITHDNIIWEEACSIEKYLISFYGRKDKKEGILVNKTDGGEGVVGTIYTIERRLKLSTSAKLRVGITHSLETKRKIRNAHKDKIVNPETIIKFKAKMKGRVAYNKGIPKEQGDYEKFIKAVEKFKILVAKYSLDGKLICVYKSLKDAAVKNNINQGNITNCCKGSTNMYAGFMWRYVLDEVELSIKPYISKTRIVRQYSLDGVLIHEHDDLKKAAIFIGFPKCNKTIGKACRKEKNYLHQKFKGFIWKYK